MPVLINTLVGLIKTSTFLPRYIKVLEYPLKIKILKQLFASSRCCYLTIMKGKWGFLAKLLIFNEI